MKYKRNLKIKSLTASQKAYLAGMIDGEGALSVTKSHASRKRTSRLGYCFRPVLHVASTHSVVLSTLQKWTGLGKVGKFDDARPNRKARYQWMAWSNQAAQIVRAVQPFLIIKKEKAKVFLRFVKVTTQSKSPGRRGLSANCWKLQHQLFDEMRTLNL